MATKRYLKGIVSAVNAANGHRRNAAKKLGIGEVKLRGLIDEAVKAGFERPKEFNRSSVEAAHAITKDELIEFWSVYERYAYNEVSVAEALGMSPTSVRRRIKKAMHDLGVTKRPLGVTHARSAKKVQLPKKGAVRRVMLTSLQNNTYLHDATWAAGINLAKYYDAEIMVGTFTYAPNSDGSEKRGKEMKDTLGFKLKDRWYDQRALPYIADEFVELAPGLVWCGHHNMLPTNSEPLRGKESLNGRSSSIYPHTRIAMRSIATMPGDGTKFNVTTGTVGLRNYMQKNAGITAEFFHGYGFLLVEINSDGEWWFRHLNADSDGVIYDLNVYADPEGVWENEKGVEALVFGDLHRATADEQIIESTFGVGGMCDVLQPRKRVFHDSHDHESRSHHNRRDPHVMYSLHKHGRESVTGEITKLGKFFDEYPATNADGDPSEDYMIDSNHDKALNRWLKEADWRTDPVNARSILTLNLAYLDAIDAAEDDEFNPLEFALRALGYAEHVHFMNLKSDDPAKVSLVVCPANGGGIELGLHGDIGPNGARGSGKALSKIGRKLVIGHSHSPGIYDGTYQVGCTAKLKQGYNVGPSSWAHCHCVIYPNGKRQLLIFWNGKWCA